MFLHISVVSRNEIVKQLNGPFVDTLPITANLLVCPQLFDSTQLTLLWKLLWTCNMGIPSHNRLSSVLSRDQQKYWEQVWWSILLCRVYCIQFAQFCFYFALLISSVLNGPCNWFTHIIQDLVTGSRAIMDFCMVPGLSSLYILIQFHIMRNVRWSDLREFPGDVIGNMRAPGD